VILIIIEVDMVHGISLHGEAVGGISIHSRVLMGRGLPVCLHKSYLGLLSL
jgi:hypothetical protein